MTADRRLNRQFDPPWASGVPKHVAVFGVISGAGPPQRCRPARDTLSRCTTAGPPRRLPPEILWGAVSGYPLPNSSPSCCVARSKIAFENQPDDFVQAAAAVESDRLVACCADLLHSRRVMAGPHGAFKAVYLGILMGPTGLPVCAWGFGVLPGIVIRTLGAVLRFLSRRDLTGRRQ